MTLRRIIRQSGLPVEVVIDLALELLDIASRRLNAVSHKPTGRRARDGPMAQRRAAGAK